MPKPLARRIVGDCLRIQESDRLWIHTWQHCYALAEETAREAQARGASVMISTTSDDLLQHVLKKAPQEALVTPPDHWRNGVAKATAFVLLEGPEDPGILKAADKGKALSITGHLAGILGAAVSQKVRTLRVRTTAFTQKAARAYVRRAQVRGMVWIRLNVIIQESKIIRGCPRYETGIGWNENCKGGLMVFD